MWAYPHIAVTMIISDLDKIIEYDGARYEGWSLDRIVASMRGSTLTLLKRGTMACLLARRELGGLLIAASKLLATQKDSFVRRICGRRRAPAVCQAHDTARFP
jgi:hypothetical protein